MKRPIWSIHALLVGVGLLTMMAPSALAQRPNSAQWDRVRELEAMNAQEVFNAVQETYKSVKSARSNTKKAAWQKYALVLGIYENRFLNKDSVGYLENAFALGTIAAYLDSNTIAVKWYQQCMRHPHYHDQSVLGDDRPLDKAVPRRLKAAQDRIAARLAAARAESGSNGDVGFVSQGVEKEDPWLPDPTFEAKKP